MRTRSPWGVCCRNVRSRTPRLRRDAANSALRAPVNSLMNFFHCSVLPAGIGNAIASIAITSSSWSAAHGTAPVSCWKTVAADYRTRRIPPGAPQDPWSTLDVGPEEHLQTSFNAEFAEFAELIRSLRALRFLR